MKWIQITEKLHKAGMSKDNKVIDGNVNWNGMQFKIIQERIENYKEWLNG